MNDGVGVHPAWTAPNGRQSPRRPWRDSLRCTSGMQFIPRQAAKAPSARVADIVDGMDTPTASAPLVTNRNQKPRLPSTGLWTIAVVGLAQEAGLGERLFKGRNLAEAHRIDGSVAVRSMRCDRETRLADLRVDGVRADNDDCVWCGLSASSATDYRSLLTRRANGAAASEKAERIARTRRGDQITIPSSPSSSTVSRAGEASRVLGRIRH